MSIDRRQFLGRVGATAGATLTGTACRTAQTDRGSAPASLNDWGAVRGEFLLGRDHIHLALMLLASHPRPVREAIERHRRALDENPAGYFEEHFFKADGETRAAAAGYMGGAPGDIALTDSTTMALATLYGGLPLAAGDEVLTTNQDHYATHENLRLRAARTGGAMTVRKVALYDDPATANADEIVRRLNSAMGPRTRAVAVTWVHSSTGVKLPIRRMADTVAVINRGRSDTDRIFFCVDGVHGFGIERETPVDLGCDFFAAGCHKWMFGPRGTGVLWGRPEAWKGHVGLIASFEWASYMAWMKGEIPGGPPGALATPGGFHSFEHRWALGEAFAFHARIGRERITARVRELAGACKQGLRAMKNVTLHTPLDESLSASLVCFSVNGMAASEVIKRLHAKRIIASVTPYATEYARLSISILNTPQEIETTLREIRSLA